MSCSYKATYWLARKNIIKSEQHFYSELLCNILYTCTIITIQKEMFLPLMYISCVCRPYVSSQLLAKSFHTLLLLLHAYYVTIYNQLTTFILYYLYNLKEVFMYYVCNTCIWLIIMSIIEIVCNTSYISQLHVLATEGDLIMLLWLWQQGWSMMTTWFIVLLIPG